MIIKRILGLIMLFTGITLLIAAFAGAYFARDFVADLSRSMKSSLDVASESLAAARETLELTRGSVSDVAGGLTTAIEATAGASQTLEASRPLVENVTTVTTQQVPEAIEGMQAALPNMIEVASVIDRTLVTLSSVGIDREIPLPFGGSFPLRFNLGIDYNPETSFDESLRGFEQSLIGLPEGLRGLEDDLVATNTNLSLLAGNLQDTSENLTTINTRLNDLLPLVDNYAELIDQLNRAIIGAEANLDDRLALLRLVLITLLIAVGLSQLAPIYLGWELLTGRRDAPPAAVTYVTMENPSPVVVATNPEPGAAAIELEASPAPPDEDPHAD